MGNSQIRKQKRAKAIHENLFALSMKEWSIEDVYYWLTITHKVDGFGDLAVKLRDAGLDGQGLVELDEEKLKQYVPDDKMYLIQRLLKTRKYKQNLILICQNDREEMERFDRALERKRKSVSRTKVHAYRFSHK